MSVLIPRIGLRTPRERVGAVLPQSFKSSFNQNVFMSGNGGREYGSWLTAGRNTAISDALVYSGSAILNIVGIIESIIQDELITRQGFSDLDVNTDSFDTAYDKRTSTDWSFTISIFDQINAFQLLSDLAVQGACKLFFNYDKEITIKAYDSSNSLDYYFMADPDAEHESLNRGRIIGNPIISPVPLSSVFSEIQVNYDYDYAKDVYAKNVYVTGSTENWDTVTPTTAQNNCSNAETGYHISKRFIYDARAIQGQATAERLCNHFADRLTQRHYICTFQTGIEGLQVEIGDFINIQSPVINGMWSGTYTTKKWEVFAISFNAQDLTYEISAIEV